MHQETEKLHPLASTAVPEKEVLLALLLESTTDCIVVVDHGETILFANGMFCEYAHVPAGGWQGRSLRSFLPPDSALYDLLSWRARQVCRTGLPLRSEDCYLRGDEIQTLQIAFLPVDARERERRAAGIFFRDITGTKRLEEALRLQRDMGLALSAAESLDEALSAMLDFALRIPSIDAGGIYLVNAEQTAAALAAARGLSEEFTAQVSRYDKESVSFQILVKGEEAILDREELNRRQADFMLREGLRSLAVIPIRAGGRVVAGLNVASRSRSRIGEHSLSIIRGIAEQIGEAILHVRTGEELHSSEERYRAIVENQTQMICRFGKAGCLTFANRSFRQAFSLGEGEISGIRIRDLLPGMHFDDILTLRLLPPEDAGIYEEELYIGEDDRTRVHYWRHKPLFDARGSFMEFQSIGQDRTDEMRRRSEERANELYGMIGRMATHVAHELKTPLTAVKMNVDLLLRDTDTGSAQRKSLAILDREVRRMQSIIRDILELARPAQLEYSTFHVVDLIEELRPAIDLRLQAAGVEFVNTAGEGPVSGDYDRLRSAFLNLVVNALEAAPAGGGVRVSTEEHGGGIARILVRDNGPGIASPDKIFSPFYTTKRGGTGLGLMIAKRIFEQHGWSLILRETSPRGTEFAVELPGRE